MKSFLHVGCGQNRKDRTTLAFSSGEWNEVRLDINPAVAPDVVGTMLDMKGVADASVDAVYSAHNLEHLHPHEVPLALREFVRVLKPEGYLIVTCPDLQEVCRLVAEDKLTEPAYDSPAGPIAPIDILYGHRPSMQRGNLFMAHKCGFTLKVLLGSMREGGFASAGGYRRGYPKYDLWAVAMKTPSADAGMKSLLAQHQPL